MIETGTNLEVTGIRVDKYFPDFSDHGGAYYSSNPGNWLMFIRYPEVVLMVAEAMIRQASTPDPAGALALVNQSEGSERCSSISFYGHLVDPNQRVTIRIAYWQNEAGNYIGNVEKNRPDPFRCIPFSGSTNQLMILQYLVFPVPNQALGCKSESETESLDINF